MRSYLGLICAIAFLLLPTLALAGNSATVNVSADVDEQLDLVIWMEKYQDDDVPGVDTGTAVTAMNFGPLTDTFADGSPAGNLFCRNWFVVYLIPKTSGRDYYVQQTGESLSSGGNTIPDNCFLMAPDYQPLDEWEWPGGSKAQGAMPAGASLGNAGSAVGTKTIYTSGTAGKSQIIRAYYAVTNGYKAKDTPWAGFSGDGIPLDQKAGTYTASVTFTVVP